MAFLYEAKRGVPTQVVTEKIFFEVLRSPVVAQAISEIRYDYNQQLAWEKMGDNSKAKEFKSKVGAKKATLPGWIFSAKEMVSHEWIDSKKKNRGVAAWRHQDWAIVNGLIMCDFDDIDDPQQVYNHNILPLFRKWDILFVFITPKGHGLKVVYYGNADLGDISENQKAFAQEAGLELDEVCFDASRLSFVTTEKDVLFLSKELFTKENEEFIQKYQKIYFRGVSSPDMYGNNAVDSGNSQPAQVAGVSGDSAVISDQPQGSGLDSQSGIDYSHYKYCGIEISDIIKKLLGDKPIQEGKRHDTLFRIAKMLRYVCERSDKKVSFFLRKEQWVLDLDSEDHNVDKTISDAMAKPYSSYLPKELKAALEELGYNDKTQASANELLPYAEFGKRLEALFDKFPCLREVCYNMDYPSYPAAVFVSAAFFGTLMTRTWYHYWFQPFVERRLNYSIIIVGDPGSGKSFAGDLYHVICEPMIAADAIGTQAINKYKKEMKARSSSDKEKKKEAILPPDNIIRIHGPRTANGVFIEDMVNATDIVNGKEMHLHMLTFSAELDNMVIANKGGQWIDKSSMEILAFHNEEDNQNYKNVDSVSGPFNVYWNFVYTGTPIALAKKVNERNFGSGLFSRLGCLPMGSDYYKCAEMRGMTKEEEKVQETLRTWAKELDNVRGELPIKQLVNSTHSYVKEIKQLAEIEENKTEAFLVNRVPYYGINVSVPFIFMRHFKEWQDKRTFKIDKYDIELCRLIMEIQMHSQRYFFGKFAEMYFDERIRDRSSKEYSERTKKSDDLLHQLPEEFTMNDIQKIHDISRDSIRMIVSRWVKAEKVEKKSSKKGSEVWKKK